MRLSFPEEASPPGDRLPEYGRPPVVETSLGIQFDGLHGYTSLLAADYWAEVRDQYPLVEERQPLAPAFETFSPSDSRLTDPRFEVVAAAIQPRFFLITRDGSELIQLQRDRFFYNWRHTERGAAYPRHTHVRSMLKQHLERLYRWAESAKIGEVIPTQCEAVYVNRIPLRDVEGKSCGLSFIFPWLKGMLGMTEDGAFTFRRRLHDETGTPVARLNFNLRYGTDEAGAREAHLLLFVRGRPPVPSIDGCLNFIDAEREVIVRTFTEVTSEAAHALWERRI